MKRLGITVAALWMAGMASAWAQTNAFQVDITGSIVQADGTVIAVKDPSKGVSGLNVTPTDTLVAIVSQDAQSVEVDFVNVASNKIMRTFAGSARSVLLSDGKFVTLLGPLGAGVHGSVTNLPAGIPEFGGGLEVSGTIKGGTKPSASGSISGIWNDSVNGDTNSPGATFKGKIKSLATNAVPENCCVSF